MGDPPVMSRAGVEGDHYQVRVEGRVVGRTGGCHVLEDIRLPTVVDVWPMAGNSEGFSIKGVRNPTRDGQQWRYPRDFNWVRGIPYITGQIPHSSLRVKTSGGRARGNPLRAQLIK